MKDTGRCIAFSISAWVPPQKAKTTCIDQAQVDGKTPCAARKGRKRKSLRDCVRVTFWRYLTPGLCPSALYRTLARKIGTATLPAALSVEFEVSFKIGTKVIPPHCDCSTACMTWRQKKKQKSNCKSAQFMATSNVFHMIPT